MANHPNVKREAQLEYHEGKSPAAWAGSITSLIGFLLLTYLGTWGFETFGWTGIIVGTAIVLAGGVITLVMKAQGYGTPARNL